MHWQKRLAEVVIVVVIAAVIFYAFVPRAALVSVASVSRGPLQAIIEEEGKTRVIDRFVVSSPVDGFARRLEIHVGDQVNKEQVLTELEPLRSNVLDPRSRAEAQARVAVAKAALLVAKENAKAAKADAELANSELERISILYRSNNISLGEYQKAQAGARRNQAHLQSTKFAVEVAAYELQAAETALRFSAATDGETSPGTKSGSNTEKVAIVAPIAGQVLKINHESEGVVQAGQALLEMGNPASLEVIVDVLSHDAVRLQSGMPVKLSRWGGDKILDGQVRLIEPVGFTKVSALGVEEQRVRVIVDITSPIADWQRLGDGYRVDASFILWQGENILQIPTNAVFRVGDQWAVFVVNDKRAQIKHIELGHRNGLDVEVKSGLAEGEVFITHPDDAVSDGARVRLRY